jgi:hypothetical protein
MDEEVELVDKKDRRKWGRIFLKRGGRKMWVRMGSCGGVK